MPQESVWSPDPPTRKRYDWSALVAQMIARPGEWLLINEQASRSLAGAVKRRRMRAIKDAWEQGWYLMVTTLNNTETTAEVWMSAAPREDEEWLARSRSPQSET